jgi:hypothetical protein
LLPLVDVEALGLEVGGVDEAGVEDACEGPRDEQVRQIG